MPPTPKIPAPPRDLVAEQRGERVRLRWSLPMLHTDGTRLRKGQQAEVFRWFTDNLEDLPERFAREARAAQRIPEDVLAGFVAEGVVEFVDRLGPERLAEQAGRYAVYGVRALNRKEQAAGFSNLVALRVYPVAEPIAQLRARVTERAIELRWAAPTRTTSGTPLAAIAGYHIYRRADAGENFQFIGTVPTARYDDADFQFGEAYHYRVRTLAQFGTDTVEGDNSASVSVTPRDVFPPPTPAGLVALTTPGRVDLTWDASPAADLTGYFLYRREETEGPYERLTPAAIPVQSFSDTNVAAGKTYYYVVTAVDRDANESALSEPAAATLPPE